jgi:hypothetical protein
MWTYIKRDEEGDFLPGEREKFPPQRTAFLAFDSLRWKVVIGFIERGGYTSILDPNVDDDCNLIAFAPLSETTDPDLDLVRASCPWDHAAYPNAESINLLRNKG